MRLPEANAQGGLRQPGARKTSLCEASIRNVSISTQLMTLVRGTPSLIVASSRPSAQQRRAKTAAGSLCAPRQVSHRFHDLHGRTDRRSRDHRNDITLRIGDSKAIFKSNFHNIRVRSFILNGAPADAFPERAVAALGGRLKIIDDRQWLRFAFIFWCRIGWGKAATRNLPHCPWRRPPRPLARPQLKAICRRAFRASIPRQTT
jgi:hypothetical protein